MNWIDAHLGREQSYKGPAPPVSIVILVHNEKINIADCLRSCAWSEDVHVLDCGSSDGTCAIARELGAKVYYNPFSSFCQQRNWAIDHIPCKYPWHFHPMPTSVSPLNWCARFSTKSGPMERRATRLPTWCPAG